MTIASPTLRWWFLFIGLVAGLFFARLSPPGKIDDEVAHFERTWTLAHGKVLADVRKDGDAGAAVPVCFRRYLDQHFGRLFLQGSKMTLDEVWDKRYGCEPNAPSATRINFGNTAVNSPVTYAPQVIGVAVAEALKKSLSSTFFIGRLAALAAYLALGFAALTVAPRSARPWLFVVALLPTALTLAGSLSSDTMVLGCALLAVAATARLRCDPTAGTRHRVALAVSLLALALVKNAYWPFVFLWLLVPEPAERSRLPRPLWRVGVPVAGVALAGSWAATVRDITKFPPSLAFANVDPTRQLTYVTHHPWSFVAAVWNTVMSAHFFGAVLGQMVDVGPVGLPNRAGVLAPGYPNPLALAALAVALGAALFVTIGARRSVAARRGLAVVVAVGLLSALLSLLGVYLVASPIGFREIFLVRGRYFTPLLGLWAIPLADRWVAVPTGDTRARVASAVLPLAMAVAAGAAVFATWAAYYR